MMSDISEYVGKFRVPKQTQSVTSAKVQRRPRESAVCRPCRISKLRCNRGRPSCGNCVRKGLPERCDYDHSIHQRAPFLSQNVAEDRLARLESLVKELIQIQSISIPAAEVERSLMTPDTSSDRDSQDSREQDATDENAYVGFTHWSAVLDEIDGLKKELNSRVETQDDAAKHASEPAISREPIFGAPAIYSLQQIIEHHLPQKIDADRLLSLHFQNENFILPFIHTLQFQGQYRQFWADITRANPLWLSILFSIFHLASLTRNGARLNCSPDGGTSMETFLFHLAAGQCLVVGEYHRPQEFVVEALLMYAHCKSITSLDPQRETGVIHSMAVRSAYQLGYHRDPDHFKGFTPFEGEMRRRTWAVCKQLDLMTSFQLGLPSSICLENCDTKHIRNLRDTDFGPESRELPASRPDDEVTRLLWFVVKDRQMASFAKVCRDALSHREKSELEIQELDQEIRKMHGSIPVVCKVRLMSESIADDPFITVTRIYLDLISQKSLCVLHRKHMARGNESSTIACLNAGRAIVHQFLELYRELAPGGRLHELRWMLGCYTMNDFLLGTTVLCVFVHNQRNKVGEHAVDGEAQVVDIMELLQQAHEICLENSIASKDASRVARIVQYTLGVKQAAGGPAAAGKQINPDRELSSPASQPHLGPLNALCPQDMNTTWDDDPFDLLQPFSVTDNGMADMDWAIFDPSMSFQNT